MNHKKKQAGAASKGERAPKTATNRTKRKNGKKRSKAENAQRPTPNVEVPKEKPLNSRQEKFAVLYAEGKTATEAYKEAYGNTESAEAAASRLLTSVKVQERVKAIQTEAAAGKVLTLRGMLEYLTSAVLTPLGAINEDSNLCQAAEYLVMGGIRGKLKRGNADSGNEEEEPETTTVKIKMVDKLKALELAARLQGMLRDELRLDVGDGLSELLGAIRAGE